jgi:hypothetical protein
MRRLLARALAAVLLAGPLLAAAPASAAGPLVEVWKTPRCGCCVEWIEHLEAHGFRVERHDVPDLSEVKRQNRVPRAMEACHTALVGGYVVEGHVPAADVQRLLREKPEIRGLAVPGMPLGSPGMESPTPEPYSVYTLTDSGVGPEWSRHEP